MRPRLRCPGNKKAAGISPGGFATRRLLARRTFLLRYQMLPSTVFKVALGRMTASVFAGSGM